ncbi:AraC family transcriptional regulator ligand-binding domain-containing protein [Nocardia sp. NPDC101769]|uniref:AraC family transcriptional regulator ligand-binding domain-containing protein n=1 Tax=Nocardia sp. NPDC101769 TaxID=3364333 RepID=UPI0038025068
MAVQPDRRAVARPAVATRYAVETGRAQGIPASACLAGTGLRGSDLEESGAQVRSGQELRVIRNLIAHGGDPAELGAATGRRYALPGAGIVGYAMVTSPTVREAIRLLPRYFAVTSVRFEPSFTETAAGLAVAAGDGEVRGEVRAFLLTRDLTAARTLVSALMPATGIALALEFGPGRGGFTVPPEALDRPARPPDAHTGALCIQQCELALDRRHRHTGAAARVRRVLLRTPAAAPSLAEVARELSLSERGLHRRLADQHISFRGLVDQIRQLLAAELLELGLTAETVARMVGSYAVFGPGYPRRPGTRPGRTHDIPR